MSRVIRRFFAAACTALMLFSLCGCSLNIGRIFRNDDGDTVEAAPSPVGAIAWATGDGVTVVTDPVDLNERVDKLYQAASEEGIDVEYKNEAFSTDGTTFACYIGNPSRSNYPMYITIYADTTFQEELFISGLLKPGQAFNKVTMSRALEDGVNVLPVCYTQVYEPHTGLNDTDDFTIRGQTVLTLNFNVVDESVQWSLDGE